MTITSGKALIVYYIDYGPQDEAKAKNCRSCKRVASIPTSRLASQNEK